MGVAAIQWECLNDHGCLQAKESTILIILKFICVNELAWPQLSIQRDGSHPKDLTASGHRPVTNNATPPWNKTLSVMPLIISKSCFFSKSFYCSISSPHLLLKSPDFFSQFFIFILHLYHSLSYSTLLWALLTNLLAWHTFFRLCPFNSSSTWRYPILFLRLLQFWWGVLPKFYLYCCLLHTEFMQARSCNFIKLRTFFILALFKRSPPPWRFLSPFLSFLWPGVKNSWHCPPKQSPSL